MKIICEQRSDEGLRFFNNNICGSIRAEKESGGDKRVIEMCEKNTIIYDDYNSHVKTDQSTIGTLTTNIGSSTRRNGTKLIETLNTWGGNNMENVRVRKLTPKECWRLMGFSDKDFEKAHYYTEDEVEKLNLRKSKKHKDLSNDEKIERVSNSQLYKQAGNSIVVDVLYYIMRNLKDAMPYLFENIEVGSFFSGIGAFEKALDRVQQNNSSNEFAPPIVTA